MENIILNIIITISMTINISTSIIYYKKIYQDIKARRKHEQNLRDHKTDKKLVIVKNLQYLKTDYRPLHLYAKLDKKTAEIIQAISENYKQEKPEIYFFTSELLKNIKQENIKNLIINSTKLTINYHKKAINKKILGTYDAQTQTIEIYENAKNTTLYHELLHVASSNPKYCSTGFKIILKQGGIFGNGLNEGYTELLNNRFFGVKSSSYLYLQKLAQLIENFYENKEEMINDYFHANIFNLIKEMLKSMTLEEIIDILVDMDYLIETNSEDYIEYLKIKKKIIDIYNRNPTEKIKIKTLVNTNHNQKQ